MRFLAWGSNITGAIDPKSTDQIIAEPRDVTESLRCEEILWTGWAGTVGRTATGIHLWGISAMPQVDIDVKRILGFDSIVAYLDAHGHVCDFGSRKSAPYDDASISGQGTVYTFKRNQGVSLSTSLDAFFSDNTIPITHPALNPAYAAFLYSMESRAFVHAAGPMHQLFEIISNEKGKPCEPYLALIEDLEGMEFKIVPGPCNRLGIVTTAGSAYILERRSQEVELIDAPGDVELLGLGSDFEVVVVGKKVYVRGNNEFGQLGRTKVEGFAELLADDVVDVKCSRWSTILTI